jgi:GST-like protein
MIKFTFIAQSLKIALYLEETEEPCELVAIDTRKVQHSRGFQAINPMPKHQPCWTVTFVSLTTMPC